MSKAKVHKRNAGSARHRQGVKLEPKELRILKWCSGQKADADKRVDAWMKAHPDGPPVVIVGH